MTRAGCWDGADHPGYGWSAVAAVAGGWQAANGGPAPRPAWNRRVRRRGRCAGRGNRAAAGSRRAVLACYLGSGPVALLAFSVPVGGRWPSAKMMCPRCSAESPSGQRFCGQCGAALALVRGSCGTASPAGQKFCGECGAALAVAAGPGVSAAAAAGPVCSATRWLGMSASRWAGLTGDGKGPAGGVGGALRCPGCRGGGRVVVVSRLRGRSACPPGRGGHWSFTSVIAARTAVVSAMVL